MIHQWLFRRRFIRAAAPAALGPYPDWHFGREDEVPAEVLRRRRVLWDDLDGPSVIRWLEGLRIPVYPGCEICRVVYLTGFYEPNEFYWLSRELRPGHVFIDVGANLGLYTLFAGRKVGPTGRVVALEPSRRDFDRMTAAVELNRLENVTALNVAASDEPGEVELLVAADLHSGHNTLGAFAYEGIALERRERVHVERIDDIVRRLALSRVDLIKMDIEGAELRALKGCRETLRLFRPKLLIELSDRTLSGQGARSDQVWKLLADAGYHFHLFDARTGELTLAERNSSYDGENLVAVPLGEKVVRPPIA